MTHLYKLSAKKLIPSDFCREVFDFTSMTHLSAARFHISHFKRSLYFIFNVEEFNFLNTDSLLIRSHMDHAARNHIFAALHISRTQISYFPYQCKILCKNITLRKCGSGYRCAALSMCESKRDFLRVPFMLYEILWHYVVWCGLCVNAALYNTFYTLYNVI